MLAITIKIVVRPEKGMLELFQKFSGALIFIITLHVPLVNNVVIYSFW